MAKASDDTWPWLSLKVGMIETEVIHDEIEVAAIGFEENVEYVANDRDAANRCIDTDIEQHFDELVVWDAKTTCFVDDDEADGGCGEIAYAGDQSEN